MPVFGAIGVAVAGSMVGAATSLSAIAVGVVTTAVVGAAVGGLTAAVTGGDIGKGMLFGAVGSVATAGILSGVGAATGMFQGGTFGIGQAGAGTAMSGANLGYELGFDVASTEITKNATSSFLGGALGNLGDMAADSVLGQLVTKGIDFAAGAFTEDPYNPNMDPDFLREQREDIQSHDKEMAKLAASLRGGTGSSGAKIPWQNTEEGAKYTLAEQWKQSKLREDSAMGRLMKQFALQDQSMEKEHNMLTAKFGESAALSGTQQYEGASEEAKAATLEKQATPVEEPALGGE